MGKDKLIGKVKKTLSDRLKVKIDLYIKAKEEKGLDPHQRQYYVGKMDGLTDALELLEEINICCDCHVILDEGWKTRCFNCYDEIYSPK